MPSVGWDSPIIPYSSNFMQWRHTPMQQVHLIIVRMVYMRWQVYPRDQRQISVYTAPITDLRIYVTA